MKQRTIQSLTRDIKITLLIKFFLLFVIWFVCFKHVEKRTIDTQQWLIGPSINADKIPLIQEKLKGGL